MTLPLKFWNSVNKTPTCWLWTAGKTSAGYGLPYLGGGRKNPIRKYAHILAYEDVNGPVPDGKELDHTCRNRACVNPDHLEPVTHKINLLRGNGIAAKNARKTHCCHGHELVGENLFIDNLGRRVCLICRRITDRKRRLKKHKNHASIEL